HRRPPGAPMIRHRADAGGSMRGGGRWSRVRRVRAICWRSRKTELPSRVMPSISRPSDPPSQRQRAPSAVVDTLPALVIVVDADGHSTYTNAKFHDYSGLTPQASSGAGWLETFHRDDRDRATAELRRSIEAGHAYDAEYRLRRHDGAHRWHLCRTEP